MSRVLLEAVAGSVEEALAADAAGIDRIELCAALPTGGVTPSLGMLLEVKERCQAPVVFMVRSREGRPDPDASEARTLLRDIKIAVENGADEIIAGCLLDGRVDLDLTREMIAACQGRPFVFHRIFDMTRNVDEALDDLMQLGATRVLTSGGADNVDLGMEGLTRLVQKAAGAIEILPGGGVRPHNARRLVTEAGCRQLHFSFRQATLRPGYQGDADTMPDPDRIAEMRRLTEGL